GRDLVLVVDEDGAETLETTYDVVVVHDLVPDIDRRTVLGEQALDDLDRAVDSRTKRPRCRKQDAFAHAIASSPLSARRAPTAARSVTSGCRAKPRRKPRYSTSPSAVAPTAMPPSRYAGASLIAPRQPTR